MNDRRIAAFREGLKQAGVAGAILIPSATLRYLTGLSGHVSERISLVCIPTEGDPSVVLPVLERPQASAVLGEETRIFSYRDEAGPKQALRDLLSHHGFEHAPIGVEGRSLRLLETRALERAGFAGDLIDIDDRCAELRIAKDEAEVAALHQAIALTERALGKALGTARAGMTERQLANAFLAEVLREGAEGWPFQPIVVTGSHGDSPHAAPSDRPLRAGELVTIDCGATAQGYPGDITRVASVGPLDDPQLREIFEVVLKANEAGRAAAGPGVAAEAVDRAARTVIAEAGYGEYFIHRTGHGLGLEVHEPPYIMEGNPQPLLAGMVFTVEPGIYLPGIGGARIEDDLLITETGAVTLTTFPRDPYLIQS